MVKTRRKLFGKAGQQVFLSHLAGTCNVKASARAAGVTPECVYQRRRKYPEFRADWQQALEQGYARLEARALEQALGGAPADGEGDPSEGEGPLDKDLTIFLLREHKKGLAGMERPGAAPQAAAWPEVEAWCVRRLQALKARLDDEGEAA